MKVLNNLRVRITGISLRRGRWAASGQLGPGPVLSPRSLANESVHSNVCSVSGVPTVKNQNRLNYIFVGSTSNGVFRSCNLHRT
uniref:Uncharacterized protein n=1 Tax=Arundo donax TaxID=35708 RepID=A0A0A9ED11_ARUDO